jgi:assimilatory nitrate reductase catalytic subunit
LTAEFPLSLLSGRLRDQWHGMSRTGNVPRLYNLEDEPLLGMHACDMRHRGLASGDLVKVTSRRGEMVVRIAEQAGLKKGRVWLPMHWGSQFMNSAGANGLISDAIDPYSQQPELKHAAVQVSRTDLPYPLCVIRRCASQTEAIALQQKARVLLQRFAYATLGLYGSKTPLVVFRAAQASPIDSAVIAEIDQLFGLAGEAGALHFADAARHVRKKALAHQGRLLGVRLAGEAVAQAWLKQAIAEDELDAGLIRFALAPTAKPPIKMSLRHVVCKCADVSDVQIQEALAQGVDFPALQEKFKCGTFCGSCVPEIKRMQTVASQKIEIAPA